MYVADTLQRINDKEFRLLMAKKGEYYCEFCDEKAIAVIPVYNPADFTRGMPHEVYTVYHLCEEHLDDDSYMESNFYCPDCGELFIINHSWDTVCTRINGQPYCQQCALKHIVPIPLEKLLSNIRNGQTEQFLRINGIPYKNPLFECEYSGYDDFPGYASLEDVANSLRDRAEAKGLDKNVLIIPLIIQTYQFAVALGFWEVG